MLTAKLAEKSLKKDIKRFYKDNHSSFSFKGLDDTFLVFDENEITASAIVSQLSPSNTQLLLHGVLTKHSYRKQGLAQALLHFIERHYHLGCKNDNSYTLHCFVLPALISFYQKRGFQVAHENTLNEELQPRFIAYKRLNPTLEVMTLVL